LCLSHFREGVFSNPKPHLSQLSRWVTTALPARAPPVFSSPGGSEVLVCFYYSSVGD
jgi:hypothetical protein